MWRRLDENPPPEGEVLKIITANGLEAELVFKDNLWWFPDYSMYVYYTPLFWKRMGT